MRLLGRSSDARSAGPLVGAAWAAQLLPALLVIAGSGLAVMIAWVPLKWCVFVWALALLSIVLVKYPAVYLGLHVSGLVPVALAWAGLRETTGWSLAMLVAVAILGARTAARWREWLSVPVVSQVAFALLVVCSLAWAPESGGYGLEKVRHFLGWAFVPFLGVIACGICGRLRQFAYSFFACLLALTLASLAQPPDLWSGATPLEEARLTVFFYDPIGLGRLAAISLIFAVWLAICSQPRRWAVVGHALIPPLLAALALTQTRGALVAAVGGLLVLFALARRRARILVPLCILAGVAALLAHSGPLAASDRYQLLATPADLVASRSVSERLLFLDEAWRLWLDSPVAGAGVGAGARYMSFRYPHNILLEIAAEFGIAGIALFLLLVGAVVVRSKDVLRHPCRRAQQALYLSCFAGALLAAQFSYDIQRNALVWIFAAALLAPASRATPLRLRPHASAGPPLRPVVDSLQDCATHD